MFPEFLYNIKGHDGEWEWLTTDKFLHTTSGEVLSHVKLENCRPVPDYKKVLGDMRSSYYAAKMRSLTDRGGIYKHILSYPRRAGKTSACNEFLQYICKDDVVYYCGNRHNIKHTDLSHHFVPKYVRGCQFKGVRSLEDVVLILDDVESVGELVQNIKPNGNNLIILKVGTPF